MDQPREHWLTPGVRHAAAAPLALLAAIALGVSFLNRAPSDAAAPITPTSTSDHAPGTAPSPRIDINAADAAVLELLPGVGPALAARILDDRRTHGPFKDAADLQRVRGIGPRTSARIAPHVTFSKPTPDADAEPHEAPDR